jgi:cytochrome c
MKLSLIASITAIALAGPAFAQDAAKGEKEFKKCKACHSIVTPDGTAIYKGGKVGPNLYNVVGRPVASVEGFKYKDGIKELGATGAVWTAEDIASYITDPSTYLEEKTGDPKAKSGMTWKQKKDQADIAAYLASPEVSPGNAS